MRRAHMATVFGCGAVLLSYPDERSFAADMEAVAEALPGLPSGGERTRLGDCCGWLSGLGAREAGAAYVEAFDLRRRRSLYLSYYRYGDTRERGMALAALAETYRTAGFSIVPGELPDFLPALLELAASHPAGEALLAEHRASLGALQEELQKAHRHYAGVVSAVSSVLGPLDRAGQALLARYRELGPPSEDVGLEPFAPPEVLGAR